MDEFLRDIKLGFVQTCLNSGVISVSHLARFQMSVFINSSYFLSDTLTHSCLVHTQHLYHGQEDEVVPGYQ